MTDAYLTRAYVDSAALFRLVEPLATATRGAAYLDGARPGSPDELGDPEDLALGVTGTGVSHDRWPTLAAKLLAAIDAETGA